MVDYKQWVNKPIRVSDERQSRRRLPKFVYHAGLIFIGLVILVGMLAYPHTVDSKEKVDLVKVTVSRGDTIWSIANEFKTAGVDIRELVFYIKQVNQLTTAQIYPGQVILIPLMDAS